jgi:hypothetical protein
MWFSGVVSHPGEWRASGYYELSGGRKRYRVINQQRLLPCLRRDPGIPGAVETFREWYCATVDEMSASAYRVREAVWTEAAVIGTHDWVERIGGSLRRGVTEPVGPLPFSRGVGESDELYALRASTREQQAFWSRQQERLRAPTGREA